MDTQKNAERRAELPKSAYPRAIILSDASILVNQRSFTCLVEAEPIINTVRDLCDSVSSRVYLQRYTTLLPALQAVAAEAGLTKHSGEHHLEAEGEHRYLAVAVGELVLAA